MSNICLILCTCICTNMYNINSIIKCILNTSNIFYILMFNYNK